MKKSRYLMVLVAITNFFASLIIIALDIASERAKRKEPSHSPATEA